jgi:predicted nucleic acid-binding protein
VRVSDNVNANSTSTLYLLDTSAILAWLEGEEGRVRVRRILKEQRAIIAWVSLMEVFYITLQEQGEMVAVRRQATLRRLPVRIVWEIAEPIQIRAAQLKARHRVSFADAVIAAYAVHYGAVLLHKDPEFNALQGQILLEALPFKTT